MSGIRVWAEKYLDRGYAPIPIGLGQKGPRYEGWQDLRVTRDTISDHFKEDSNVGLLLGEPSGGLIDIDLDTAEAARLAPDYLPPTWMISGRNGVARHWWYRVDTPPPNRMLNGVEMRGTGLQTVVAPSLHPDGSRYEWFDFGQPARVTSEALLDRFYDLADALAPLERDTTTTGRTRTPPAPQGPRPPFLLRMKDLNFHMQDRINGILRARGEKWPSTEGERGSHTLTGMAVALVRGFMLRVETGFIYLERYNRKYARPMWEEEDLVRRLEFAEYQSRTPWGRFLVDTLWPDSLPKRAKRLREWVLKTRAVPPQPQLPTLTGHRPKAVASGIS
jgi:hypothetical protein